MGGQTEAPSNPKKMLRQSCEKGLSMTENICVTVASEVRCKRKTIKLLRKTDIMSSKNFKPF